MSIVKHLLVPLVDQVVLNKRKYDSSVEKGGVKEIRRDHLGIGRRYTWRGAPDWCCDVDKLSDTESTGAKTLLEAKPEHQDQNSLFAVIGISGGRGTFFITLYDPLHDVLVYTNPTQVSWYDGSRRKLVHEGVLILWLVLVNFEGILDSACSNFG